MLPLYFPHAAAGWLALLGLAVPLAIYLWNRKPGRVVRVGSVRWLEAAANQRLRSLKPQQLLLFLLRATIVGLLALALTEPVQLLPAPPRRGQVLLAPGVTTATLAPVRTTLDSLRQRGYELRQLRALEPLSRPLAWATLGFGDTTAAPQLRPDSGAVRNLWNLVQLAADSLPGRPLVVVAALDVAQFSGSRPTLPAAVRWLPLPAPDSGNWPVAAWQPHPDSLIILVAQGSADGTRLRRVPGPMPATSGPVAGNWGEAQVRVELAPPQPYLLVRAAAGPVRRLPLLTRAPRWLISHDAAHAPSARVLRAALRAVGSVLPLAPRLTIQTQAAATPPDSLDWVFWLRDAPLPAQVARRAGLQIWQEAAAATPTFPTQFRPAGTTTPVLIQRLDTLVPPIALAPWRTATGRPLLTWQAPGRYVLRTRLDPAWSRLVDSPDLPAWLLPLLLDAAAPGPDFRQLAPTQLYRAAPTGPVEPTAPTTAPVGPRRPLATWLVLAAAALFALERLLAARRATVSPVTSVVA